MIFTPKVYLQHEFENFIIYFHYLEFVLCYLIFLIKITSKANYFYTLDWVECVSELIEHTNDVEINKNKILE